MRNNFNKHISFKGLKREAKKKFIFPIISPKKPSFLQLWDDFVKKGETQ